MYARFVTAFCLLYVSTATGRAESLASPGDGLELYLKPSGSISPGVLSTMRGELVQLMQTAGVRVRWRNPRQEHTAPALMVIELKGACSPFRSQQDSAQPLPNSPALASTAIVDGRVTPFTEVDCGALNRSLVPLGDDHPDSLRAYIYGRAMARILAHEIYHYLAQTSEHTEAGITKEQFSTADLLADHLFFEPLALERLHPVTNPATLSGAFLDILDTK
jgi:hypothetical protein